MNKKFALASLTLAVLSAPAVAQQDDTPDYENWIGVYGLKYVADEERPNPFGELDDGFGLGIEYGHRFTQSWAARLDLAAMDVEYGTGAEDDETGYMVGADAMYFLPDDVMYFFGGVKHQKLLDEYTFGNVGIGKHWHVGEDAKIITEVATHHNFDDSFTDYSVKIGFAVPFGQSSSSGTTSSAPAVPADSDNDGVVNSDDRCPNTPAGTQVDANGCAMESDDDQDGVMNSADQCPNTPRGAQVDAQGCEVKDSDMDGVNDANDQCADTPRGDKVDAQGCTIFDEEEVSITLRVLFDRESAVVKQPNDPEIQALADFMKRFGSTSATIEGHTSAPGAEEYNMNLSQARADAFKDVMVERYGIDASRLNTQGYGETQLLDTDNDAEAHRANRRISVSITETVKVPEERE